MCESTELKAALIGLLQRRMDKCTTEQFWAVAAVTGLGAFAVLNHGRIVAVYPKGLALATIAFFTLYSVAFIWSRHWHYYDHARELAIQLRGHAGVPDYIATPPEWNQRGSLWGVVFYMLYSFLAGVVTFLAFW
jgi:hypothetical protein